MEILLPIHKAEAFKSTYGDKNILKHLMKQNIDKMIFWISV